MTVAEATGGMVFGLSDETPLTRNDVCEGNDYNLTFCEDYEQRNTSDDYCQSGNYQAGVRCIQSMIVHMYREGYGCCPVNICVSVCTGVP